MIKRVPRGDYSGLKFGKHTTERPDRFDPVKKYPDGREECRSNSAGKAEYKRRTLEMAKRQGWICGCGCGRKMNQDPQSPSFVTFEHVDLRGGGRRNDAVEAYVNVKGETIQNQAWRYECNVNKGSQRTAVRGSK